jgi:TolB-like protein/DNA-binding SARP family transcriptional activator
LEFRMLGPVEVVSGDRKFDLDSPKERALLLLFLLHPGRVLSVDRILSDLWPERPPGSGARTVRYHISKIREAIGDASKDILVTASSGYALDVTPDQVDAYRFERLVDDARTVLQEQPDRASRLLRDALSLWRGDALSDVDGYPFATPEIRRLENLRMDALEERIQADLVCGRHGEVVGELQKLTEIHPMRERLFGQLMLAQYRLGRQADALRTCQRLRRTLAEELGVDAGRDIDQLEERILVHDPGLILGPPPGEGMGTGARASVLVSVVVLPFENLSHDEEDRFFADGLTEDLIHGLAEVDGLRVISRTSAFAFRERAGDVRDVGRQLRAQAVVSGSVRRAGKRIRITAELVDVADGYQLWSGRYDRDRRDIFAVQEEVAQAIASVLRSKLDRRPIVAVPRHTTSMDAYDAFLQGRYFWHQQTDEGFRQAVELFERAVELDPEFGKPYAWLAIVRMYWTIFGYVPPGDVIPVAREEARRALELDPNLTEAHLTLGLVAQYADWNWELTERHYRRAIELSPGNATARTWYGLFLARMGRGDEAVAQSASALDLDPLAHESSWMYLIVLTHLGRHTEAVALGHKAAKVHPLSAHVHWPTGLAHIGLGEGDQALEWIRTALRCDPASPYARAFEVYALSLAGERREAERATERLIREKEDGFFSPFILAIASVGLGDHEGALDLLEESMKAGDGMFPFINHWAMSPLADEPRYQALLDAVNLRNLFAPNTERVAIDGDRRTPTPGEIFDDRGRSSKGSVEAVKNPFTKQGRA